MVAIIFKFIESLHGYVLVTNRKNGRLRTGWKSEESGASGMSCRCVKPAHLPGLLFLFHSSVKSKPAGRKTVLGKMKRNISTCI